MVTSAGTALSTVAVTVTSPPSSTLTGLAESSTGVRLLPESVMVTSRNWNFGLPDRSVAGRAPMRTVKVSSPSAS